MAPVTFTVKFIGRPSPPTKLKVNGEEPDGEILLYNSSRQIVGEEANGESTAAFIVSTFTDAPKSSIASGIYYFQGTILGKKGHFSATLGGPTNYPIISAHFEIIPETTGGELKGLTGKGWYELDVSEPHDRKDGRPITFSVELP
ncbi:uncharacterized protein LOC62_07G008860 [Vanrija pseudolonga]|uniref:Uncharacterized protein n=1 Tax=Vanrija pseudolonga TaxID=143232 RepID=A0AAF0YEP4_9TREE|nr:hypothetical protein LOC62_07G008860 [Vanrija pseudolonga]